MMWIRARKLTFEQFDYLKTAKNKQKHFNITIDIRGLII